MVETLKISEMTDGGDFELDQIAPVLESGANRKVTVQLQFAETGNTAQRPVSPANPTIRYNTDFEQFEYWNGLSWTQIGSSGDVAALIARLAAHTPGDGASMIGLENQGSVSNKTVQDMSEADFIVKTTTSSLVNGFALSSLSTGFMVVTTGTGALVSRTLTGSTDQITVTNGTGLGSDPQFSIAANPQLSGTSNVRIPFGTTGQRPGVPSDGMIRYNTTSNVFEWYNSSALAWQQGATTAGTVSSITGTANQVIASSPTGAVTLSLPQDIGLGSTPTFAGMTLSSNPLGSSSGGTGINNGSSTLTLAGSLATIGAFAVNFTFTGATGVTFPTSGTLATTAGTVSSVSGTANRITSTGGTTPVIDISAAYVGQTSITTLGTIATGTWQGTVIGGTYGGTGVNNGASTITLGGSLTTSGAFASTFTMTGATNVTFPTSGTLLTSASAVTSITGTANQITASASVGAVTLSIASNPILPGTGGVTLPTGNTAARAGGAGTMRFNSQTSVFEATVDGATWATIETSLTGVTSVSGTANRITSTGGTTPIIDISAAYVGQTSITTLGTIATGTWQGTTVGVIYGGTGLSSVAQGDLLYGSASNVLSALAKNTTATRYLSNTGTSNNPAWAQVDLSNGVTGTLPVANGGTGITSFGTGVATALGQNVTGSGGIVLATSPTITTPKIATFLDTNGNTNLTLSTTASAVNYVNIADNSTGLGPVISAQGSDSNIILNMNGKGTGGVNFQGTSTNDSASAGYVGEFISSAVTSGSAVSLTTATAKTITSISLTAGDWDVWGNIVFTNSGTASDFQHGISTTNNTLPSSELVARSFSATFSFTGAYGGATPSQRVLLSGTTTVYIVAYAGFNTGAVTAYGGIYARRRR